VKVSAFDVLVIGTGGVILLSTVIMVVCMKGSLAQCHLLQQF
jgi:hypothetical protein